MNKIFIKITKGEDKITEWRNTSSLICLSILTVLLLTYFACDIFFLEKFLRYTFSTYIQFLIAFAGILGKNWNGGKESSSIFSLILAIIVAVMFLTKLAMLLKRLVIYVISKL